MTEKEMLSKLLELFYVSNGNLEWGYLEGTGVRYLNPTLNMELLAFIAAEGIQSA